MQVKIGTVPADPWVIEVYRMEEEELTCTIRLTMPLLGQVYALTLSPSQARALAAILQGAAGA